MSTSTVRLKSAALARLQAELPALATGEGLPPVQSWLRHDPGLLSRETAPTVWVTLRGAQRDTDSKHGAAVSRYAHARMLIVGVTMAAGKDGDAGGADPDDGSDALEAYADLIRQVVEGDQTAGGEGLMVRWMNTQYSPNEDVGERSLFQGALLFFEIPRRVKPGED